MCSLHWKIGAVFYLPDTIVKSSDETIYSSISAPGPSCRLKLKISKSPLGVNNQQGHRSAGNISSPIQSSQDDGRGGMCKLWKVLPDEKLAVVPQSATGKLVVGKGSGIHIYPPRWT